MNTKIEMSPESEATKFLKFCSSTSPLLQLNKMVQIVELILGLHLNNREKMNLFKIKNWDKIHWNYHNEI